VSRLNNRNSRTGWSDEPCFLKVPVQLYHTYK
jgi:hypothetical protein